MNIELETPNKTDKDVRFDNMTIPNARSFIVAHGKVQDFKNVKPNLEITKRNKEMAQKIRINNLTETEEPKKRILIKPE